MYHCIGNYNFLVLHSLFQYMIVHWAIESISIFQISSDKNFSIVKKSHNLPTCVDVKNQFINSNSDILLRASILLIYHEMFFNRLNLCWWYGRQIWSSIDSPKKKNIRNELTLSAKKNFKQKIEKLSFWKTHVGRFQIPFIV